uniref:Tryptophan--tRNA ligase n=1 Tax=Thermosporothrix sp. COM3 TaxID=2490863 RepID=A0A455SPL2_9CHLR|nr:tryptophan--tRNA ligase [Thermosporothrix sp. COM3]
MEKKRMLTGDRPTGKLHLGHYIGTLKNRVRLQHEYESFFIIADLHMLTTKHEPEHIREVDANARQLVLDSIAAGIEPEHVTFYLQSGIHEIHEMETMLQNLVTVSRLERIPSLKEMARAAHIEMPYGLLGYPVLQAADILCVRSHIVPVGKDNAAHVEVTRELARRFNNLYGEIFPVPEVLLGEVPTLVGIDGQAKMSKSLNNAIFLSDTPKEVEKKVMRMYTDPNRVHANVPGTVEGNPVFIYHDAFNPNKAEVEDLKERYRAGTVGDVEVKQKLAVALNAMLDPMRERRAAYDAPGRIEELIYRGTQQVREETRQTLYEMQKVMGWTGVWNRIRRKAEKYTATQEKPRRAE